FLDVMLEARSASKGNHNTLACATGPDPKPFLRCAKRGFQAADGIFDVARAIGDVDLSLIGDKLLHAAMGRDHGAVTSPAEELADLAPCSSRVLAREPHGQHSRL